MVYTSNSNSNSNVGLTANGRPDSHADFNVTVRAQTVERPVVETHYVDRIVEKEV